MEEKKIQKSQQRKMYERARLGAIIFLVPHLLIEIIFFSNVGQPIYGPAINLAFSLIILKNKIVNNNKQYEKPLVQGLIVSTVVFLAIVVLQMIAISSGLIG